MDFIKKLGNQIAELLERVPAKKIDLALAVIVTLLGLVVYAFTEIGGNTAPAFGFLHNIELRSLDARFKARGPREADNRIVIVGIDEKTLQKVGAWPIPRDAYGALVEKLASGGAKVVAFDVAFPLPEKNSAVEAMKRLEAELTGAAPQTVIDKIRAIQLTSDNDVKLAESLKKANNVILGHLFLDKERAKSMDKKAIEDYFYVLSGKPFPQKLLVGDPKEFADCKKRTGQDNLLFASWQCAGGLIGAGVESNIRLLAESSRDYGFFDNNPDADGTMRSGLLMMLYQDDDPERADFFPSLSLQSLRLYEDIKDQTTKSYFAPNGLERIEAGPYNIKTRPNGTVLINFTGPYLSYRHYSMADVIDGTVPAETFKDKIIFVGATAKGIGDLRNTPFPDYIVKDENNNPILDPVTKQPKIEQASYMGVEIHANILDNLLHSNESGRSFLKRSGNEEMIDVFILAIMGLGLGYLFGRLKPLYSTLVAIGGIAVFSVMVYIAFAKFGMWLTYVIPAGTILANYASITSFRMIFEEREKRKIRKSFSSYVSPGVINLIEKDPKKYFRPGGEMKELTIMFSDIRSFTTISEGLTPDELVHLLNEYLGEMTEVLFKRWGTLDKYIGDAIMGFWGSPFPQEDHAIRACACALDMSARLDELNMKWEAMFLAGDKSKRQLSIGIGLNTGPVNVGNMGSDKRLAWTVMGDHVNLASRLEGQTKDYGIRTIVGEATYLEAKDHYVFRDLDRIRVKGKLKPVNIYQLLGFGKDAAEFADLLSQWNAASTEYRRGNWPVAIQKYEILLKKYPNDGPSQEFLKRCHEKLATQTPLGEWDGVWVAKSK
ncbi:MAG TPA: adenylate/guanylate cyclase domain-containing protein [Terriglobales bacterium]|nr:adenylate/guanylate cyclase domain-containing protein [Terriglobales bacterium]